MKKAISLVELMIAVSLMGVVILGATVFDMSSRKFMNSSELKTTVTNELHLVLDYIQKDVAASSTSFASVSAGKGLRIYQDTGTPFNTLDDQNVTYLFGNVSTNSVERCDPTGACRILSQRFTLGTPPYTVLNSYSANFNSPAVRYKPLVAMDNSTNPQVSVPTVNFYAAEKGRN
jgi:hypothetical protein